MNDNYERIDTHDEFREHTIKTLAIVETNTTNILDQLKRMNGTQQDLLVRTRTLELGVATIHNSCPLNERVTSLDEIVHRRVTEDATKNKVNARWVGVMKPVLYVLGGALGLMLLTHLDTWISLIKH